MDRHATLSRTRLTLDQINRLDRPGFVAALCGVFEHSPWIAESAFAARPFASIAALHGAMVAAMQRANDTQKLSLPRAQPELAGRAAIRGELTADSTREQTGAGLAACSRCRVRTTHRVERALQRQIRDPFILAVKGYDQTGIIADFARRVENDHASEFAECLQQVAKITRFRLDPLLAG